MGVFSPHRYEGLDNKLLYTYREEGKQFIITHIVGGNKGGDGNTVKKLEGLTTVFLLIEFEKSKPYWMT